MKISDPIGKVYQHSMFKKKSYNIPNGADSDILDRSRAHSDEEDEDEASDISEQSDDSLSTKSSRIVPSSRRARTRSNSRHRRPGRDEEEAGERDREDAISYASRNNERGDRRRSSSRKGPKRTSSTKKYGLENIGPPGTSYSLWTSRKSLKRDHKRKFNRSMCGVLLGVSVVLVVLGILGIIGIAVYLGVVQKIESPERDLVSIDGAFRVVSEDFSLSLLNPSSIDYKEQEEKFTRILSKTYRKSILSDAFIKIAIDGFSSGSIKVFFKVILDKSKIPEPIREEPVMATKDVLMQEVMSLDRSEFQDTIIDIDSIDFSLSKVQELDVKYLEPEPFQGSKQETTTQSARPPVVNLGGGGGSLWQNLAQSTARPPLRTTEQDQGWPPASASDRVDTEDSYSSFNGEVPLNANGWSLPRYPTNTMYDYGRPNNLLPNQFPNIVTPETPVIISPNNGRQKFSSFGQGLPPRLPPVLPSFPPRRQNSMLPLSVNNDVSSRPDSLGGLMSEYMEPPPPPPPPSSSREESINSLESLFGGTSNASPVQSMSPSETYFKMTPKPQPQTQNRRIDISDDSDKYNGFWKMLQKPERKQNSPMPSQQFHQRKSSAKDESITSMQQELEHLLMLESQHNNGGANLYDQIQMMDDDEIKQLADKMAHILEPQNNNQNNQPSMNPWRTKPSRNQDPVSVNNFGSSGLKKVMSGNNDVIRGSTTTRRPTTVVDFTVPKGQSTGFFGVGSSLSFGGGGGGQNIVQSPQMRSQAQASNTNSIVNSVGSLNSDQLIQNSVPMGSDPNIVYPSQIRAGTQMMQGPQGPIVSSPRPLSLAVPQTPLAPQLPNPGGYKEFPDQFPGSRGSGAQFSSGQRQASVSSTRRPPGTLRLVTGGASGGQLRQKQTIKQTRGETQQSVRRTGALSPGASERQGQADIIGNILPAAMGLSGSAGISPIGIFSNLLNAYATIDSKHDLTGKIINSAASWLTPEAAESRTTDVGDPTTTPTSTTSSPPSTLSSKKTTTSRREKPITNISVRVNQDQKDESQYQSIFDKIRAAANSKESEYDIVTNYETNLPPMKSNIFAEGPLRPKPPSEEIIQVSPAPHDYSYDKDEPPLQYAVGNPNWYSNEIQASTAGYGPDDFIVETVNLDKNFFYQFFTSKPMIIDTDVVTSTSVKVKHDIKPKKGRDTKTDLLMKSSRETLMNLPEHLIGKDILPNHILKKTGEAFVDDKINDNEQEDDELELVQFKRYNLPAEIQITSGTGHRRGKELEPGSEKESER